MSTATHCHCSCECCQFDVINICDCPKIDNFGNVASSSQPAGTPLSRYQDIEDLLSLGYFLGCSTLSSLAQKAQRHATTVIDVANSRFQRLQTGDTFSVQVSFDHIFRFRCSMYLFSIESQPVSLWLLELLYIGFSPLFNDSRLEVRRSCADALSDSKSSYLAYMTVRFHNRPL